MTLQDCIRAQSLCRWSDPSSPWLQHWSQAERSGLKFIKEVIFGLYMVLFLLFIFRYLFVLTWLLERVGNFVVFLKERQYGSSLLQGICTLALLYGLLASPDPDLKKWKVLLTREKEMDVDLRAEMSTESSRGQQRITVTNREGEQPLSWLKKKSITLKARFRWK